MDKTIQITQITPELLVELINDGTKNLLADFKKEFPIHTPDELMTREQTLAFLHIDPSTLWAWTKKGKVTVYGIGHRRYYKRSELLESLTPLKKAV
jgi:hypothetical protein